MLKSMSDDERAIRELLATWFEATKMGDTQTVLKLVTDDVVFMVPGREPFGKEAFQRTSDEMKGVIDGTSDIQELRVLGDWAFMRTRLSVTMTPPERASVTRSGYTLTILRKEADGRWRLARDANLLTMQK
jgi:uncharacterized protein (TIGR02246 family)